MRKKVLIVALVLSLLSVMSFSGCNQNESGDKDTKTAVTSDAQLNDNTSGDFKAADVSDSVSGTIDVSGTTDETSESGESQDMGALISEDIKAQPSYKKLIAAGKGDAIIIKGATYTSEYFMFDDGEIAVIDRSTEDGNEYNYMKYTAGQKMYTVDIDNKLYVSDDIGTDDLAIQQDKETFLYDLVNYLYYGLEYKETKDGVEYYEIPLGAEDVDDDIDIEVDETSDNGSSDASVETSATTKSTATSAKADVSTTETADRSATATGEVYASDTSEVVLTTGESAETSGESSEVSMPEKVERHIKVTDKGVEIEDIIDGESTNKLTITVRKCTAEDKKLLTVEGFEEYSQPAEEESYDIELPSMPDTEESAEDKTASVVE